MGVFRQRVQLAVESILQAQPGRTVAVICHGGVIRMILSVLLDLPLTKMAGFDFEYASLTVIDCMPHRNEVQLLNFTPWRDKSKAPNSDCMDQLFGSDSGFGVQMMRSCGRMALPRFGPGWVSTTCSPRSDSAWPSAKTRFPAPACRAEKRLAKLLG